ncbi:primase-helicase family protein [Roseovarius phycicola]|uniref:Primase-helicase family protein n=1 Tax=Roseovarius phycicola TaxID=3080976 RepID=A0ABZ2HKB1_9RHOB
MKKDNKHINEDHLDRLTRALCSWFVRRDGKYYAVGNVGTKLSRPDVEMIALKRFQAEFADIKLSSGLIRQVFDLAIDRRHTEEDKSIAVWNGKERCAPEIDGAIIEENGTAAVNAWSKPDYRRIDEVQATQGIARTFFEVMFPREPEREMFLNWLAWCLQNEADKPNWVPFLYSATKGSGKSTLCQLVSRLFGERNSVTLNSVDKLTSRFNATVLTSKLVVCEEVNLRQDSPQGNTLKTYITESRVMTERKGQDAQQTDHRCCFLLTSNHLPLWIEAEDRRYYLIDIDHDGHANGPHADHFARLVEDLHAFMADDHSIAALYRHLMERRIDDAFSAKTLNIGRDATALMRRVQGASEQTVRAQLREMLDEEGFKAVTESRVADMVQDKLKQNINSTRHAMTELGWSKFNVKWDGKDYGRDIWVSEGYRVEGGKVKGPDGYSQSIGEHLARPLRSADDRITQEERVDPLMGAFLNETPTN